METENFFFTSENEVQNLAQKILKRELTELEYHDVKKTFQETDRIL